MNKTLYLLSWEKETADPNIEPIEVEETQDRGDEEDAWVIFHYTDGYQKGLVEGAPRYRIITAKEADLVRQTATEIYKAKEDIKRIRASIKEAYQRVLRNLEDPEREI